MKREQGCRSLNQKTMKNGIRLDSMRVATTSVKKKHAPPLNPFLSYDDYINSSRWRHLRRRALDRDGHRCRICNSSDSISVHHRYCPTILGTETLDALTTLCGECHKLVELRKRGLIKVTGQYRKRKPKITEWRWNDENAVG